MTNRRLVPRQHIAAVLTARALGTTGLITAAPAHAGPLCPGQVEVASTAGTVCITPLPAPGTTVNASGTTTVTNNTLVPAKVISDTGATAKVGPGDFIQEDVELQFELIQSVQ
ncbi:hypothetical protein GCM10010211_82120 [Streptomyces albospinus]|uniref:Uncharacterized protein n=1 Tax=Streptomyces albospinus TaxID=285515 RepID=A0ABQ2VR24_9ACTN|nr:hypothetical protein [Streptomyces albospinus]GGV02365.1 hypothetical protein GCM10010211_82120 [Streptomyces albospinus]